MTLPKTLKQMSPASTKSDGVTIPKSFKDTKQLESILKVLYDKLCKNKAEIPYKTLPPHSKHFSSEQLWTIIEQSLSDYIIPDINSQLNHLLEQYKDKLEYNSETSDASDASDASDEDNLERNKDKSENALFHIIPPRSMILFRQSLGLPDYSDSESDEASESDLEDSLDRKNKNQNITHNSDSESNLDEEENEETSEDEDINEFVRKIEEDADEIEELQEKQENSNKNIEYEFLDDVLYGEVDIENMETGYGTFPEGQDSELDDNLLDEYEDELRKNGLYNDDSTDEEMSDDEMDGKDGEDGENENDEENLQLESDEDEDSPQQKKRKMRTNSGKGGVDMNIDEDEEDEFEKYESELIAQMEQLENENLKEKTWQEGGEATAKNREVNALLEEDLRFDHSGKAAPIIDQKANEDIESIIIYRIMENIFDDPEKPEEVKEKEDLKRMQISAEKDRKSLVEIYEKKFMETIHGVDPEEENPETIKLNERKAEIKNSVTSVLQKLNAMSSFHYVAAPIKHLGTDKLTLSEIAKSSAMKEDTNNIIRSDALEATASEIMTPLPYLQVGSSEMEKTDRKRKRRLAKHVASKKARKTKELVDKFNPSKSVSQSQQKEILDSLKKVEADADSHKLSKSKDFFTMLQENMEKGNKKDKKAVPENNAQELARQKARYNRI